ncbi:MAG: hypothetical protein EOM23_01455 [Candidatus Moranbacteria bacterium]|nr:hypothetical protein [Candidatus Moranbacteria bacterium]
METETTFNAKDLFTGAPTIQQIEQVAKQYFEAEHPFLDMDNEEDKELINYWDLVRFVYYILSQQNTNQ